MADVSVVIPIYNTKPEFFSQALNSIRIQKYDIDSIEVCVHDDGSDPSLSEQYRKIIAGLPRLDVTYSRSSENYGVGYARNCAASDASGEYLLFLDSDDLLHKSATMMLVEALERNNWADVAYSDNVKFTYPEIDIYQYRRKHIYDKYARIYKGTAYNPVIRDTFVLSSICIRREVFKLLDGYADSAAVGEHSEFLPRLHEHSNYHNLVYVPRTLYFRRHLTRSLSRRKREELHARTEQFLRNAGERADLDVSRVEHFGRVAPYQVSHYMFYDSDGIPIIPPYLKVEPLRLVSSNARRKIDYYWEEHFKDQIRQHLRRVRTK